MGGLCLIDISSGGNLGILAIKMFYIHKRILHNPKNHRAPLTKGLHLTTLP